MGDGVVTTLAVAAVASALAGVCVRRTGRTPRARGLWWVAAAVAAAGAAAAAGSAVPVVAGLAAGGLSAGALIDAAEGRIPTVVAHGTTAVSLMLLATHAAMTGEWARVIGAVAWTGALVLLCTTLWLARQMGFGDVRFAAATVSAMTAGVTGLAGVVGGAFAVAGGVAVGRRVFGRSGPIPFGPPLLAGWFLSVWAT